MVLKEIHFKSDKQIESELLEYRDSSITEAVFRRFLARPSFAQRYVNYFEFELLRDEVERLCRIIANHEGRIRFIEAHERSKRVSDNLKLTSQNNVKLLREMFELPELGEEVGENVLAEMRGMLEEYSEEGTDSVDLLHSLRGD